MTGRRSWRPASTATRRSRSRSRSSLRRYARRWGAPQRGILREGDASPPPDAGGSGEVIDRRTFLFAAAGGLLSAPLAAEAQQPGRVWRIGLFHVGTDHVPPSLDPLKDTLKALGYEDGKNLRLD